MEKSILSGWKDAFWLVLAILVLLLLAAKEYWWDPARLVREKTRFTVGRIRVTHPDDDDDARVYYRYSVKGKMYYRSRDTSNFDGSGAGRVYVVKYLVENPLISQLILSRPVADSLSAAVPPDGWVVLP